MNNIYNLLAERGFIQQATHEREIKEILSKEKISFYIGFDPTADSLTVGHFLTVMAMTHMQRAGHRPIILVGGGTGMVGDPTDKTEMRRVMTNEEVKHNADCFKAQLSKFIDFSDGRAIMVDNADWLMELKYIPFIREYGIHFSVNRMLTADAYRTRFEKGLTFFEFNYMLMQSYDFLELFRRYNCKMQMGGNDQWSNILGGVELIRRVEGADAYGLTFTLLTTSEGKKMGKSQQGAVWLDSKKTSPYDFFQYWRNVDDADIANCLRLLTFLPLDEINNLTLSTNGQIDGNQINNAKEILAFEVTKLVHGKSEAENALQAARALFGGGKSEGSIPTARISATELSAGKNIIELMETVKLCASRSEARRIIEQGGLKIGDKKISNIQYTVTPADFTDCKLIMQKGKKTYLMLCLE